MGYFKTGRVIDTSLKLYLVSRLRNFTVLENVINLSFLLNFLHVFFFKKMRTLFVWCHLFMQLFNTYVVVA